MVTIRKEQTNTDVAAKARTALWEGTAQKLLLGRKIVAVHYMTEEEAEDHGWDSRGVVMVLDNGLRVYPSADDEGNNAGALFTSDANDSTLPVL